MRFMAQRAADRFGPIAEALGVGFNEADSRVSALACAERIDAFIARLGVARRLRDVGVPADELGEVAGVVHGIMEGAHALDTPAAREEIEALLRAAY